MPLRFDHPEYLWLLLLALPIVLVGMRSLHMLEPSRRCTALAVRLFVLLVLVLMLSGFQFVREYRDLTVVAVTDVSESVRRFYSPPPLEPDEPSPTYEDWVQAQLHRLGVDKRAQDRLGIVRFDARPMVTALPQPSPMIDLGSDVGRVEGTHVAAAIRLGMALFEPDSGKRMLLFWDGNDTTSQRDLITAAHEARAAGIPIDVVPLDYRIDNEVLVERIYAPTLARREQSIALNIKLAASEPSPGTLYLQHDGVPVQLAEDEQIGTRIEKDMWTRQQQPDGAPWVCFYTVELPMQYRGVNQFQATFQPDEGYDRIAQNNAAQAFTVVEGQGQILFVDHVGGDSGRVLPHVLRQHGIDIVMADARGVPSQLESLNRYDAVIFQNVAAEEITQGQQRMIAEYVNNLGGGFLMLGGPDSFGAGGWAHTPIDRILPLECELPSRTVLPAGALVLVIDRSGSMAAPVAHTNLTRQAIANEAAVLTLRALFPQDLIGVVAFDRNAQWVVPMRAAADQDAIARQIRTIQPGGGTHIYPGLVQAVDALAALTPQEAAVKHIILLTDGMDNPDLNNDYPGVTQRMVNHGITLTTVGIGEAGEIDDELLANLARQGQGQFYHVTDPRRLPQIFIKEARTVRRNLVKEVDFTPVRVGHSPITAPFDATPPLRGLVVTGEKNDPRVVMPWVGPDDEPLFAHWQVGLGRVAAFTSDATNRWAANWLDWGGYAAFWKAVVDTIARPSPSRAFDLHTRIERDRLHMRLDAHFEDDARGAQRGGGMDVRGTVITPAGRAIDVVLTQTGPGVYETSIPAREAGNYVVTLGAAARDGQRFSIFGGSSREPGEELRRFASNRQLIEQIAQITGGQVLSPQALEVAQVFDRTSVRTSRSLRPMWYPLLLLAMGLFLADVATRRLAWSYTGIVASMRQALVNMAGILQSRDREAQATMQALRQRRARTDERLRDASVPRDGADTPDATHASQSGAQASATVGTSTAATPASQATRGRKFDATDDYRAQDDLAAALDGAKQSPVPTSPRPDSAADTGENTTRNRLLDAKRRARRRMTEQDDN